MSEKSIDEESAGIGRPEGAENSEGGKESAGTPKRKTRTPQRRRAKKTAGENAPVSRWYDHKVAIIAITTLFTVLGGISLALFNSWRAPKEVPKEFSATLAKPTIETNVTLAKGLVASNSPVTGYTETAVAMLPAFTVRGWGQTQGNQQKPKHKTKVAAEYDQSKNETALYTERMVIWKPLPVPGTLNFERVNLALSFSYPGKKIATPQSVVITVFAEQYSSGRFAKQRDLSITTEAQKYQLGEMELARSGSTYVPAGPGGASLLVTEKVTKSIPFADFDQISQSKKVKMQIGRSSFKLEKEHLEAFRNFVALMREEGLEF